MGTKVPASAAHASGNTELYTRCSLCLHLQRMLRRMLLMHAPSHFTCFTATNVLALLAKKYLHPQRMRAATRALRAPHAALLCASSAAPALPRL
jgi:hypothetical protein